MRQGIKRRKINAHSSDHVFTLLKSVITSELERNGSEEDVNLLMQQTTHVQELLLCIAS